MPPAPPVEAHCPEPEPIIERGFRVQPPLCLAARQVFRFQCSADPAKPGYCRETFADVGLQSAGKIADDATCMALVAEWIAAERASREGVK